MRALFLLTIGLAASVASSQSLAELKETGKLIFADDFERMESDDAKEELGRDWVTNSKNRAQGVKQADLVDGALLITMAKVADHAVSVRHDLPFDDGIVESRFKLHDDKGMGFNFNDPGCKDVSWAGHVCAVRVLNTGKIMLRDDKTGIFDLENRKLKESDKAAWKKRLKCKQKYFPADLKKDVWYTMTIVIRGPKCEAYIDGKKVGEHESPGFDHAPKRNLAYAVPGKVSVDDLKVWSLDK